MHWKTALRTKCRKIVQDMVAEYDFDYNGKWTGDTAWTDIDSKTFRYVVKAKYPKGYVTLAIFLHEVGHVVNRDCEPSRTHDIAQELRAWQFARRMFDHYGLPWTASASAAARERLQGSIQFLDPTGVKGVAAAAHEALKTLEKTGI